MRTSGTIEEGLRLLEAFHDLSGGNLTAPVPAGDAATRAGIGTHSVERDIAVRYLLNNGYLKAVEAEDAEAEDTYTLTVPGKDRVKEMRGIGTSAPNDGGGINEQTQQRLETLFVMGIGFGLGQVTKRFTEDLVPERRGIKDDILRATLRATTTAVATVLASMIVRRVAQSRRGT